MSVKTMLCEILKIFSLSLNNWKYHFCHKVENNLTYFFNQKIHIRLQDKRTDVDWKLIERSFSNVEQLKHTTK